MLLDGKVYPWMLDDATPHELTPNELLALRRELVERRRQEQDFDGFT